MRAIETVYNGYRFRSRLEARWAVFFDALGVEYEYEPEGYIVENNFCYLPDFKVKCYGCRGSVTDKPFDLFIEVKGNMTKEDAVKIKKFAGTFQPDASIHHPILIVGNIPPVDCSTDSMAVHAYEEMNNICIYPFNYFLIDGDYFGAYPAATENGRFYLFGDDTGDKYTLGNATKSVGVKRKP